MEKLKLKLFDALAYKLSIKDFENWLYEDAEILEAIETNMLVYDIVCLDYTNNRISRELERICMENFDEEEFLTVRIERNCHKLLWAKSSEELWKLIYHISSFRDWDNEYRLLYEFIYMEDCITPNGNFIKESDLIKHIHDLSKRIISKFEGASLEEKVEVLKSGKIEDSNPVTTIELSSKVIIEKKKRFQFWK